jgi:hypothetical protein
MVKNLPYKIDKEYIEDITPFQILKVKVQDKVLKIYLAILNIL